MNINYLNGQQPNFEMNPAFVSGPENLHALEVRPVYGLNSQLAYYRATLMWIPATSSYPISRYDIYRGENMSQMRRIGETSKSNYADNEVQPGRTYFYYVVAINNMNISSPASNTIVVTT